jgi:hypothetical protein
MNQASDPNSPLKSELTPKPHRRGRQLIRTCCAVVILIVLVGFGLYIYNNAALMSNDEFSRRLDIGIERAISWVETHKADIHQWNNIALIRMLQDCESMRSHPATKELVDYYVTTPANPDCWRRLLNPAHFVRSFEINPLIEKEPIDNKWILYAIAPEKAQLDRDALDGLFDDQRWRQRQLTHQLWALIHLRRSGGPEPKTSAAIDAVSRRLSRQLQFDLAVVDIYIQKIAFTLFAGHPELIRRRWVERVLAAQRDDGGWNDRWGLVLQSRKRPAFDFSDPPSDQHATIQALWLLYQVKYRYPDHFGAKP